MYSRQGCQLTDWFDTSGQLPLSLCLERTQSLLQSRDRETPRYLASLAASGLVSHESLKDTMTSQSVPPPPPPWAGILTASLCSEPQFHKRQVLYFPGSSEFTDSENDYFNASVREVQSVAVARPTSTADISALLKTLRRYLPTTTPIAVRGAGHATYVGTAKAAGGVTIDSESPQQGEYCCCLFVP